MKQTLLVSAYECANRISNSNNEPQLFVDFTDQSLLKSLTDLDFPTRKLPLPAGSAAGQSPRCKNAPVALDHCSDDVNVSNH